MSGVGKDGMSSALSAEVTAEQAPFELNTDLRTKGLSAGAGWMDPAAA